MVLEICLFRRSSLSLFLLVLSLFLFLFSLFQNFNHYNTDTFSTSNQLSTSTFDLFPFRFVFRSFWLTLVCVFFEFVSFVFLSLWVFRIEKRLISFWFRFFVLLFLNFLFLLPSSFFFFWCFFFLLSDKDE